MKINSLFLPYYLVQVLTFIFVFLYLYTNIYSIEIPFCTFLSFKKYLTIVPVLLLLLSHFSRVRLCATPQTAAHQAPRPWDSPGKNIGVGCHFLLQCMKVKNESEVAQSCLTLSNPMDCSLPGSSVHEIFQARVLEWDATAFSTYYHYLIQFLLYHSCNSYTDTALLYTNLRV